MIEAKTTKRLIDFIEKQSLKRTFVSISEDIGLDEGTIRNIFRDYINRLEETVQRETPKYLGIDEIHIIRPRCVICNIKQRTVIDLLRNRNKETVIRYLYKLPNREIVRYVCMDMWEPYRDAVTAVLPQAIIVIDKFHVVRMANQALETVRKGIREKLPPKERRTLMHDRFILLKRYKDLDTHELLVLEPWLKNFKDLGTAYQLKEQFYDIWDIKGSREALQRYQEWKDPDTRSIGGSIPAIDNGFVELGKRDICLLRSPHHERLHGSRQQRDQGHKPAGQGLLL